MQEILSILTAPKGYYCVVSILCQANSIHILLSYLCIFSFNIILQFISMFSLSPFPIMFPFKTYALLYHQCKQPASPMSLSLILTQVVQTAKLSIMQFSLASHYLILPSTRYAPDVAPLKSLNITLIQNYRQNLFHTF